MLYIFYGPDQFSLQQALLELKKGLQLGDMAEANTSRATASELSFDKLKFLCNSMPFLASQRLIVVEGLLSLWERPTTSPPETQPKAPKGWEGLPQYANSIPPTTTLALIDGSLRKDNPMLRQLGPLARVREFPAPRQGQLQAWLTARVASKGGRIAPRAAALMADTVGSDLWGLDQEIEKLCLYSQGHPIQETDVRLLVSQTREVSVFSLVDALLDGSHPRVWKLLHQLRREDVATTYIIATIGRQLRRIMQTKHLLEQRLSPAVTLEDLGHPPQFLFDILQRHAKRHSWDHLRALQRRLLEADRAIKTGLLEEEIALELLLASP